jgi:hypothetical protein
MGVDTKGFILTKEKNPFVISRTIKASIIQDMMRRSGAEREIELWETASGFTCPTTRMMDDFSEMLDIDFEYAKEQRMLGVFLDCDHDYEYVRKGKKIILSLGMWGSSVHLIEVVLRGLHKEFGGVMYIIDNDCADDWRKIK